MAAKRSTADFKQQRQRELLRLELGLLRADQALRTHEPAASWKQLVDVAQPLLNRLEIPGLADPALEKLKQWFFTLMGDTLLALIVQAWQQGAPRRARRWLTQANIQLKNAVDYPDRDRHRKHLGVWRQKLKEGADPFASLQKLMTQLEVCVDEVRQASLSEARSLFALMSGKLQRLRKVQAALPAPLEVNLADEIEKELTDHIEALEQAARQQQHVADLTRLQAAWPREAQDQATPHAFRLALVCKASSASEDRAGFDALQTSFDQQNARRALLRAVDLVRSNSTQSLPVKLARAAVRQDPSLAPVVSVLLGATAFSWLDQAFPSLRREREKLLEQGRVLAAHVDSGAAKQQIQRAELLRETDAFLRRLSTLLARQGEQCGDAREQALRNSRELSRALSPLIRYGSAIDLRIASQVVDHWRKVSPDAFDPRHPLHRLHRRVQVQQRLVAARELLTTAASETGAKAAGLRAKAKALAADAIHLGIDRWRPLREAVRLYGIAQLSVGNDTTSAQQFRCLMKLVAAEYAQVRNSSPERLAEWIRKTSVLTADRWIQRAISTANERPKNPENQKN